jgi:hypothetical protein
MSEVKEKKYEMDPEGRGIDLRILSLIVASENVLFSLPDASRIAEYCGETLVSVPGIKGCRVCIDGTSVQRGTVEDGVCGECLAKRKNDDSKFQCDLGGRPGFRVIPLEAKEHFFGFLVLGMGGTGSFGPYEPFVDSLANFITLSLENRLQKDLLQEAHDSLELKVRERTEELNKKVEELKKFTKVALGRELRIVELKEEVKKLKDELSRGKAA